MSSPKPRSFSSAPSIRVSNLTYTYEGSTHPALYNIDLTVKSGEFVIIAGPSGSGKSTLARCLTGFIPNEYHGLFQGTITVEGLNTQTQPIRHLARSISLIQQDPDSQLVTLQVTNEVAFGLENFQNAPDLIKSKIQWAIAAVNATNLHQRSTHTLSGGEKQKVVIASFLGLQSPILIFDEPIARLDPQTTNEVITTMENLHQQGITIIVIEHRIQPFLNLASRAVLMNKGQIQYDGSLNQLSAKPKTLLDLGVALHPSEYSEVISNLERPEQNLIEVHHLNFTYPRIEEKTEPQPALQNMTFSVPPGEIIALMGANGSGKSTLLLQLMGLIKPDSGTVHLRNHNIHERPVSELARDIGFVFQNPLHQLFAATVKDEVLLASKHLGYPEPAAAQERAEHLLDHFGLLNYQEQSPHTLSLGEQRRLTIASIILHKPQVLLLDEPFIGQDYRNVHHLMTVVRQEASQGTAVILATHDTAIAEHYCHRLLFLFEGRLLIDAPVKQGLKYMSRMEHSTDWQKSQVAEEVHGN
ncbi:MAG: ABC transporter ATP-binding protein [Candidatus Hermodarchaeia archaeon]